MRRAALLCGAAAQSAASPGQVRHFVAFSYNASAPAADIKNFTDSLLDLPNHIPEIMEYRLSPLAQPAEDAGAAFNVLAESLFASDADYLSYRSNPYHSNLCPDFRKYLTSRGAVESYADNFAPEGDFFDSPERVLLFPKLGDGVSNATLDTVTAQLQALGKRLAPGATSVAVGRDLGNIPAPHQWNNNEFVIIAVFRKGGATSPSTWKAAQRVLKPYLGHCAEPAGVLPDPCDPDTPFGREPHYITVTQPSRVL